MGQRITRAKAKIKAARIPYRVPSAEDLPARVSGVLAVLFLVFNEGYLATGPDTDPVREDLTAEAIRLTRLIRALLPEDGEVAGLLALMLLTEARRAARVSASGELVTAGRAGPGGLGRGPDRRGPPPGARAAGLRRGAGPLPDPGRDQRRAHLRPRRRDTDWSQVVALYDQLVRLDPRRSSPSTGPSRSPSSTAPRWRWRPSTGSRTRWRAITPSMRPAPSCCAGSAGPGLARGLRPAIELAGNTAEIAYLTRRRDQLG